MHYDVNVQPNADSQSYGEHSVTDDNDNVQKECNARILRAREILLQADEIMKSVQPETEQNTNKSEKNTTRRISRQQSQNAQVMVTRTRSHS